MIYTLIDSFDGKPICHFVTSVTSDFYKDKAVFEDENGLHMSCPGFVYQAFKDHTEAFEWLLED